MAGQSRPPSRTAILTAVGRALHLEGEPPHVLEDRLAMDLAGEPARALAERLRHELPADLLLAFARWSSVRARFTEDEIARAAGEGVGQLVILGAGLDSLAYRRPDLSQHLRVFEVDHPASQTWKRDRLDALRISVPEGVVFAPVDFEVQTLAEGLGAAGFEFDRPAIFSWIGVTMYLTLPAIESTLRSIAAWAPGSRVVLTYNLPPSALDSRSLALTRAIGSIAADSGEPFLSLFEPAEAEALARRCGLCDVVHFGPREAVDTYFGGGETVWIAGAQRVLAASVARSREES